MEQVKTFYRRYRWLFLAAAYLAVFAVGVLYLRVTISIPPEGDDKLTLNRWMYDFQRMPFWQYLLQDLQGRLRYFTLQEVRFFPFHYPNAVALLFYGSLSHYRLYIIAWTGAAAFLALRWPWRRPPSGTRVCTATTPCPSGRCSGPWRPGSACLGGRIPTAAAGLQRQRCSPSSPAVLMKLAICSRRWPLWFGACVPAASKPGCSTPPPRWAAWAWRLYSICCAVAAAAPATRSHWISPRCCACWCSRWLRPSPG